MGWHWLTRLKANRQFNPDGTGNRAVAECAIREAGTRVHLKGYGFILVFRIEAEDGNTEYWATDDLTVTMRERASLSQQIWTLETYHRGINSFAASSAAKIVPHAHTAQPYWLGATGIRAP